DAPWLWGYHPKDYGLYHKWYQNIKPNRISNNNLKYLRVNTELRALRQHEWNKPVLWPIGVVMMLLILGFVPAIIAYRRRESSAGIRVMSA
ncbi:MAG: peptide ABC transporter substrate-binding protein, partial [Pseudomonadota bacterium]